MQSGQPRAGQPWRNWPRTVLAHPAERAVPADVDDVVRTVCAAARRGLRVKPVGSGHSASAAAATDGVQLDLRRLDRIRSVEGTCVTVEAGIALHRLSPLLWERGLALQALGDIDRQTLAGALATGTHGTGAAFGSLASRVRGLELVLADGDVVTCSPTRSPHLFHSALVGLGAFGVVTAVTLDCVPAFALHAVERRVRIADVLDRLDELVARHDHVDVYWFPQSPWGLLKTQDRVPLAHPDTPLAPLSRTRAFVDDEVLANGGLELLCRLGAASPALVPGLGALAGRLVGEREYVDRSYRVFASRRRVRFRESEVAVPRAHARTVVEQLMEWVGTVGRHDVSFPLELRFGAAEDAWLAPAYGREVAYVSAQTFHLQRHEAYVQALADVTEPVGGRPHWGKLHALDAAALRRLYPRHADALAVRDAVDPGRLFANSYTEQVLGP